MVFGRPGWASSVSLVLLLAAPGFGVTIAGFGGLQVSVDSSGIYAVAVPDLGWRFEGNIAVPLSNLAGGSGADGAGEYAEISFDFQTDAARHAAIRSYGSHQAVLFTVTENAPAPNTFSFPNWTQYPQGLFQLTYAGTFAPPLFGGTASDSPWIFFDSARNTFILSPARNFMTASTGFGPNGELASGIAPQIAMLPQGFEHQTLLVIERGINRAFDTWGQALTGLQGKIRPPNDADRTLNQVGYWTDRGSTYYYQAAPGLSYEQTLDAIQADFQRHGITLGYMQLDSWFYPKGADAAWKDGAGGIYQYVGAPALFPRSLSGFQQRLQAPLVTHARWIDASSPYRQSYRISGNVAVDPQYWISVAAYLASSGVATYEQDWLDGEAQTDFNLTDPDSFLDNMAAAMANQGLTMQYCMGLPRHFLQSSKYSNLTTVRASNDRFGPEQWTHFLYTSRLASALGVWPFSDVLMSSETENLLLATLSAGPVGLGDPIGGLNGANLLQAIRQDGVIVKPDAPLTPVDRSYLNAAEGIDAAQVNSTYTDFGPLRTSYVLAYLTGTATEAVFSPSELGQHRPVYLYDYFSRTGQVVGPSELVSKTVVNSILYLIAAPIGPSGIAVIGDAGQFASMGKKRIAEMTDEGTVSLTVAFAAGELSRVIQGYAPVQPIVWANTGSVGGISYDSRTQRFQVTIMPGSEGTASVGMRLPRGNEIPSREGGTTVLRQ